MMSPIEIMPISTEYFDSFHACLDAVSRERIYLGFIEAPPLPATRDWLTNGMQRGTIRLIAVDGAEVVGWIDIERTDREGFVHVGRLGMGVLKAYRGQGIGTALLERSLEEARMHRLERVELDVYASNQIAIHLYEKYGFEIEGRKRNARKLDEIYDDIVLMVRFFDT
jgi:ribosomal protein S18 acetylase RimI-like enzyme